MSDFKYDETNKGTLWNNKGKYQIFRQGSINVNGEKQNFIISQTDINGKKSYPIYAQVGWINPNTKKTSEKSPDILGNFEHNTFKFKLAGWSQFKKDATEEEKQDKNNSFLSIKVEFDKEQQEKVVNQEKEKVENFDSELNDDVPF
tara:strand:- start:327 stop:764 length:438 start_codon:yes stop_codon:yes gene_type:complete